MSPDLLAGETHERRQQTHRGFQNPPDDSLGGAATRRICRRGVKAILKHIEVERAQFDRAEIQNALVDFVKSELLVPAFDIGSHGRGLPQHVLVERLELFERKRVLYGIEIVQVPKSILEQIVADGA